MRQLEDMAEDAMTLKSDYLHKFKMLYAISSKLCKFCVHVGLFLLYLFLLYTNIILDL